MNEDRGARRIIKKIGDSHVVWFPESNRWIEFREPAWFVYRQLQKGEEERTIINLLIKRYDLPENEACRFLREIMEGIKISARTSFKQEQDTTLILEEASGNAGRTKTRHYLINSKYFTISYGTPELEHYIHRPFAWLETGSNPGNSLHIEIFSEQHGRKDKQADDTAVPGKKYILCLEGKAQHVFDDAGFLKHKLYVIITSHIYGIPEERWMSYIHASGVTNGREAILLSSASGSGKSTMAAMLQLPVDNPGHSRPLPDNPQEKFLPQNRLFFMSDDFVPVDSLTLRAHPFPAALTIKKGSYPAISSFYNAQKDADAEYGRFRNPDIRYIIPCLPPDKGYEPREVKKIIFIRYNPRIDFFMEKLPAINALSLFHEEAWVSHNPGHAQRFIDWFVTLECYKIEYSDNKKTIEAIRGLFEKNNQSAEKKTGL